MDALDELLQGGVALGEAPLQLAEAEVRIDAGDHTVIIGHVDRVTTSPAIPRVFLAGNWGQFLHADDN